MRSRSLIRNILTVGGWTLMSRGAGFARDVMMAAYLGTGPVAEAFLVAFSLPNMFRRFFAEGAFNMAFVPMFAKKLEGGEDAAGFARDAASQNEASDEFLAEERSLVADSSQVSAENLRSFQRRFFLHVHERDLLCGTVGAIGGEALSLFPLPGGEKINKCVLRTCTLHTGSS